MAAAAEVGEDLVSKAGTLNLTLILKNCSALFLAIKAVELEEILLQALEVAAPSRKTHNYFARLNFTVFIYKKGESTKEIKKYHILIIYPFTIPR